MGKIYFNWGNRKYKISFLSGDTVNIESVSTGKNADIAYNKNTKLHNFLSVIAWYEINSWL